MPGRKGRRRIWPRAGPRNVVSLVWLCSTLRVICCWMRARYFSYRAKGLPAQSSGQWVLALTPCLYLSVSDNKQAVHWPLENQPSWWRWRLTVHQKSLSRTRRLHAFHLRNYWSAAQGIRECFPELATRSYEIANGIKRQYARFRWYKNGRY